MGYPVYPAGAGKGRLDTRKKICNGVVCRVRRGNKKILFVRANRSRLFKLAPEWS